MHVGSRALAFSLLLCSTAQAELGKGTIEDPVTRQYTDGVYKDWQEGVGEHPQTGNFIVTYKDSYGFFNEVVFEPATKIDPALKSRFRQKPATSAVQYEYRLANKKDAKQPIVTLVTHVTSVRPESLQSPKDWNPLAVPALTTPETRLSWGYWGKDILSGKISGLSPGTTVHGFAVESNDLPGLAVVEIRGGRKSTTWLGHTPEIATPVGQQVAELEKKDFVGRIAAVPKIPVPSPYDVLTALRDHVKGEMVELKQIDPGFVTELLPWFDSAIAAANQGNTKALRHALKELDTRVVSSHKGLDQDSDAFDDTDWDAKRRLTKLAARVLHFDLKYIERRANKD